MKILVTGGSGFIGEPLINRLANECGHSILSISRTAKQADSHKIQWLESSLLLENESLERIKAFCPDVLIHLAWEKIPDFSFPTSFDNLRNQIAFFNTIFSVRSIKKIVVTGSCWEYNRKLGVCNESENVESGNYFTWAKNSLRDFLHFECMRQNISLIWSRVFYVYGPGQRKESLIPSLIHQVKDGICPDVKKPVNSNDFVYIDDVVDGLVKITVQNIPSGIYNFGSGKSIRVIDILRAVEKAISGHEKFADLILQQATDMNTEIDFWADIQKSHEYIGWQPNTSIEAGIRRIIASNEN